MIDPSFPFASWYLWVLGVSFIAVFGLPLLLAPVAWARVFRWWVPEDTRLVVYFGRCLGAVAVAITIVCLRAASDPEHHVLLFELAIIAGALLTLVHVAGAIQRTQPLTETAEIAVFALATGLAIAARASLVP